ncbi:hypothetical protein SAMN05421788_101387 [Filimonas lacunae]|uniref:Uncharacterized protein n=1 Tax=Filimonas lacunae TaxID=477680 RepID=A0A173MN97_9BACT|nr:hypothetical protein FLA_4986 [Filimonas lacunae]SIS64352.1 hypothetical protein SAMN05421788_101387 [Filimonas lacunae]
MCPVGYQCVIRYLRNDKVYVNDHPRYWCQYLQECNVTK